VLLVVGALWLLIGEGKASAAPATPLPAVRPTQGAPPDTHRPPPSPWAFTGKAVSFDLSGFEPDMDPLYKVIISGTLHDRRPAAAALPDATLVLSAYLESFQPDTTPVLPDLLHPDQVADNLGGFLQGKAALVNAGGHIVYRGSLLAEIFADSTEHLVVDLAPANAGPDAPTIRLQGSVKLAVGGSESGVLNALQPLARSALAVAPGPALSWQRVVDDLTVRPPAMLGTAGSTNARTSTPSVPTPPAMAPVPPRATAAVGPGAARRLALAASAVLAALLVLVLILRAVRRRIADRAAAPSA
jgi:hypothetical protein